MNSTDCKMISVAVVSSALLLGYTARTGRGMLGLDAGNTKKLFGALTIMGSGLLLLATFKKAKA